MPPLHKLEAALEALEKSRPKKPNPNAPPVPDPNPNSPKNPLKAPTLDLSVPSAPGMFASLVKLNFISKFVMLPTSFDPSALVNFKPGDDSFQMADLSALAMNLFKTPSPFKIHWNTAITIGKKFEKFIDDVSRGIVMSWNLTTLSTKFAGVIINGPIGMLNPGGMILGPTMNPNAMIGLALPLGVANPAKEFMQMISGYKYAKSICTAIAQAFMTWGSGYSNTAIPFPGGAACVGTMVPSPNVPVPLASGMSAGDSGMMASALSSSMLGVHGAPEMHTTTLFDAFAKAFETCFTLWKSTNMIMNIIGAGGAAPAPTPGPVAGALGNGGMILGAPST